MGTKNELDEMILRIQKECHEYVDRMVDQLGKEGKLKKDTVPQDFINIFLYKKLADVELRLCNLERAKGRTDDYLNMHTPLM
jgi:hypothetical protein